jgi:hypothetical protein
VKGTDMTNHTIIAPHCDDEIIGCFEILNNKDNKVTIIYDANTEAKRREESMNLKKEFENVTFQVFHSSLPSMYIQKESILYFPDPIYETHPLHRSWGIIGEQVARAGYNVVFYSTIMTAPYIHEVKESQTKEDMLNKIYPSQSQLWLYEKKYVLFEGRCKWIF